MPLQHVNPLPEQVRSGPVPYVRPVMNGMKTMRSNRGMGRFVRISGRYSYTDFDKIPRSLKIGIKRIVEDMGGRYLPSQISEKIADETGLWISQSDIERIRREQSGPKMEADPIPIEKTNARGQQYVVSKVLKRWQESERIDSFEDIANFIASDPPRFLIKPELVQKIIERNADKKLAGIGGLKAVDIVGRCVMKEGMGHDLILAALDQRGMSDDVPRNRIVELWKYYVKLHPDEAREIQLGNKYSYSKPHTPGEYAATIAEMDARNIPSDDIASELGISEAEVKSHLIGSQSELVHLQMKSEWDRNQDAIDLMARTPTSWAGEDGPTMRDLDTVEGIKGATRSRGKRYRALQTGQPTRSKPIIRGPGEYDWAMRYMPEFMDRGLSRRMTMDELNSRNPEGYAPWTMGHISKLYEDYIPQQPVMAFARPSDRFVRLGQLNPGPAPGPTSGQAQSPAQPIGATTPQQEAAQKAARDQQITNLSRQVQVARQNEQQQKNQLMQTQRLRQKIEADLVALKQGRSPSPQQVV